jgi:hypothetical protein
MKGEGTPMSQTTSSARKSVPLSIRISLWLLAASILPLLLALVVSETQSRSTLISQASRTMETDAQTHAQLIDDYLTGKLLVLKSLDYTPLVQQYLFDPVKYKNNVPTILQNGIAIQKLLDPDVRLVTFFDPQGKLLLYYSLYGNERPQLHGKYMIPPEDAQQIAKGQQFVSNVYYDAATHQSTVELYTPVYSTTLKRLLGTVRDTLSLDNIWSIVNSEKGVNGSGSYAFILDQYGVRIVDPDPTTLFTSIAPLSPTIQQNFSDENRYGKNAIQPSPDANLSSIQKQPQPAVTFQEVPTGKNESFQVTRRQLTSVPWTYFVLTPVNEVIAVANQQLLTIILIAAVILLPVAIVGWIVGSRISSPILRSVASLDKSSHVLNQLSEKEKKASSEQVWIVEASKTGLKSQQYYTDASKIAARRLNQLGRDLLQQGDVDIQTSLTTVKQMVNIGLYFEQAIAYQDEANKKVAVAVNVTDEVSEQLASGAESASEAANELDTIVSQLRRIVGN